ncbi:hypothetical protein L6164_024934 [Bauhinia variegata]|uniref:Uncharacterized protein n=1 Tax=Bauhinia variegata TaxID=167791 RepID=A0ACB9M0E5_BAUVA|nr:hypothetical protein L6164_024934 [Bauhinia variegata]
MTREKQEMPKSPNKFTMTFTKRVSDLDWRSLLLIVPPLSLLVFFFICSAPLNSFSSFYSVQHFIIRHTPRLFASDDTENPRWKEWKNELLQSRIAVCLVGGARKFELTGPSILEMILKEYPNSDLFLHSPLDPDAFKFSLLKNAPRIASVRIFTPQPLPETESQVRVLTSNDSPNGIQGLIQYFNLVEGCLRMISWHQQKNNFTYDWIVRTRVDGYWNAPLHPQNFVPGRYVVPPGSSYGGLNDRLGIGDLRTSGVALSRLSLIPQLDSAGFHSLNSEAAFKAQLTTQGVDYLTKRLPFCIVTERKYDFPMSRYGVPVAAMSSRGPLSGAKCRPCTPVCKGKCVDEAMMSLDKGWSWTNWENGTLELCDAHEGWENGWEKIFDRLAGKKLSAARKRTRSINFDGCIKEFKQMRKRTNTWDSPPLEDICKLAFVHT